jgi:iron complex outermembrane recepter protein
MFNPTFVRVAALMAMGSGLLTHQAHAQAPAPASAPAAAAERVEITGSRIKSTSADSPSPLQVLNAEDIAGSGVINIQDLLLKNPTLGAPAISRTSSNFATAGVGVATIDLRGLGAARTLVLVNGRRFVSGVPGSAAVDLNTVPTDFIERIDLLTGGASSAYGSDAVAGVLNIVLKRNFEGFVFDANSGMSSLKDDKRSKLSATWGINSGKGNLMGHVGYSKQGAVYSAKRDFAAVDQASVGAFISGDPADVFTAQRPFYSSFAPQGRIFINPGLNTQSRSFDAQGQVIPWSTNGPAGDGVGATGYNRSALRTIAVPTERFLLAGKGDYNLTEDHTVFFEGSFASTKTVSRLEPFPLDSANIYTATGGQVPAEFLVGGVLVRNPLVPDSIYNLLGGVRDADGARMYSFTRRLSEVANRGNDADRGTLRAVTGLKGSLFGNWDYDAYLGYGSTSESQTGTGQVNVANFRHALEAVPGPDGAAQCRDATARSQGCVPISVFGFGAISPAAAAYVNAPSSLNSEINQRFAGVNVSGKAARLPAGNLAVAAGLEYRTERSRSDFDALTQAGLNAGNALPSTQGAFKVSEVYGEVRVPILKGLPAVVALDATAAVRGAKYSTSGRVTSWNTGLEWTPVRDVRVRATSAQATRAPDINELFAPPLQTFPTGLVDPCVGITATTNTPVAMACRAAPGVNANIAANGTFTLNQADQQGISGFTRGNSAVKQEEGKSTTLGLVLTPSALRGTAFTLDYFDIRIDDAIVPTPRQFILQQCYGGDASFCQFITRRPAASGANSAGSLSFIDSSVTNSGALATRGLDLTAAYGGAVGPGALQVKLAYTRLLDGYLIPLKGSDKDHFAGEVGSARDRASWSLGYKWQGFSVLSQTTYIGKSSLDDQFLASNFNLPRDSIAVGSKVYNDFQFAYELKNLRWYLGLDNAFDVQPPPIINGLPSSVTGTETAANVYDAIGRRWYVGVRATF